MSISFGPDGFTVALGVDACECGGANGAHRMCPVAADEIRELIATTDRERDAAVSRAEAAEAALGRIEAWLRDAIRRVAVESYDVSDSPADGQVIQTHTVRVMLLELEGSLDD